MLQTLYDIYLQITADDVNIYSSLYKLMLSMLLGCAVGYERKRKGQMAGVRTFSLIAMGATLAMIISIYVPQEYMGLKNGDPGRVAAQVVSGIGFLGAGAIIQMKGSVRGLTTAAGIWIVAMIGLAVGAGLFWVPIFATCLILVVLMYIEKLEHRYTLGQESRTVVVRVSTVATDIAPYREALAMQHITLTNYYIDVNYAENSTKINLVILARDGSDFAKMFDALAKIHPTLSISLANQLL